MDGHFLRRPGYLGALDDVSRETAAAGNTAGEPEFTVSTRPVLALAADTLGEVLGEMTLELRRPSFRAGAAAALIATAMMARAGVRPGATILISLMLGASVEKLYGMAEDMHAAALDGRNAARALRP